MKEEQAKGKRKFSGTTKWVIIGVILFFVLLSIPTCVMVSKILLTENDLAPSTD